MKTLKKKKQWRLYMVVFFGLYWLSTVFYQATQHQALASDPAPAVSETQKPCVLEAQVSGGIGPATLDFLERAQSRAVASKCGSLLLLVNTPGGNLQTTRLMVENILNSPIPVLCIVAPSGAHAGSAGAILLLACHLSGALEATNIGAATPITSTGEKLPEDVRNKMINDTVAWVQSLAALRGRSEQYAKDIVAEAKSVSGEEAFKLKAIEFVGTSVQDFLKFADGKKVKMNENTETTVRIGERIIFAHDFRYKIMDLLMNPQVAYLIFMGSLGLLYYELTHPGMIAPGVVGAIGLVVSLISLHMLDVTWGAVLLIVLGIAFMIAEAFVAGFGILGLGGLVSFFVGSLFLFDPQTSGYQIPMQIIAPTSITLALIMFGIAYMAYTTRTLRRHGGADDFWGRKAVVKTVQEGDPKFGYVQIDGELWRCTSDQALEVGQTVYVLKNTNLTLVVSLEKPSKDNIT